MLQREEGISIDPPQIVQAEATRAAVIHLEIPRAEMMHAFGPAVAELLQVLQAQGIQPAGPVFAHHFRIEPSIFDFEVGLPVERAVEAHGRVRPGGLPAARVARTVHRGPYEGLSGAWSAFVRWMDGQGLARAPDIWERYLRGPESDAPPSAWETELVQPLR